VSRDSAAARRSRAKPPTIRKFLGTLLLIAAAASLLALAAAAVRVVTFRQQDDAIHLDAKKEYLESLPRLSTTTPRPANIVVILFDDLGYGDLGAYGSRAIDTPHLDALAASGALLTNFYAAAPHCTPSRAALLTGRYPVHAGLTGVSAPWQSPLTWISRLAGTNTRLPAEEITIADVLRATGYVTGLFGKWHLGNRSPALPMDFGFQEFFGVLHSNDMSPLPLYRNGEIAESHPIDQKTLTRRYTSEAIELIERNKDKPFFVLVAHTFPHLPLSVAEDRSGRSDAGLYGDVIEELDDSVGTIVAALNRNRLQHDTLVLVTSDNGPWYQGSTAGLRGRKNDIFEGGMRVPFLAAWPGQVPAGRVISDIAMSIDLLPTVLDLVRLKAPGDRVLDGVSLLPLLQERGRKPHDDVYYYKNDRLLAMRSGRFKYHRAQYLFPGTLLELPAMVLSRQGPWLFDLEVDPYESYDITQRQPGVAHRLRVALEARDRELAANPRGWK